MRHPIDLRRGDDGSGRLDAPGVPVQWRVLAGAPEVPVGLYGVVIGEPDRCLLSNAVTARCGEFHLDERWARPSVCQTWYVLYSCCNVE